MNSVVTTHSGSYLCLWFDYARSNVNEYYDDDFLLNVRYLSEIRKAIEDWMKTANRFYLELLFNLGLNVFDV